MASKVGRPRSPFSRALIKRIAPRLREQITELRRTGSSCEQCEQVVRIPVTPEIIRMERRFLQAMSDYDSPHLRALRSRKDLHPFDRFKVSLMGYTMLHAAIMTVIGISRLAGSRILEIGAGSGSYMDFLRNKYKLKVQGLDASSVHTAIGRENGLAYIEGDARKMPFPDGSFDLVIAHRLFNSLGIITPPDALPLLAPTLANKPVPRDKRFQEDINKEVFRVLSLWGIFISQGDNIDPSNSSLFASFRQIIFPKARCFVDPINILQK